MYLWIGGFCLWLGSEVMIKGAIGLATSMGISERVISISIVSIGTSIPSYRRHLLPLSIKKKPFHLAI